MNIAHAYEIHTKYKDINLRTTVFSIKTAETNVKQTCLK